MRMLWLLPVAVSLAVTLRMPEASMSKETSILGTPRAAGGRPSRLNSPRLIGSTPISALRPIISMSRPSISVPPRRVSPEVALTSNTPLPNSMTVTSSVPPPKMFLPIYSI